MVFLFFHLHTMEILFRLWSFLSGVSAHVSDPRESLALPPPTHPGFSLFSAFFRSYPRCFTTFHYFRAPGHEGFLLFWARPPQCFVSPNEIYSFTFWMHARRIDLRFRASTTHMNFAHSFSLSFFLFYFQLPFSLRFFLFHFILFFFFYIYFFYINFFIKASFVCDALWAKSIERNEAHWPFRRTRQEIYV